jgi:hypothetical protein
MLGPGGLGIFFWVGNGDGGAGFCLRVVQTQLVKLIISSIKKQPIRLLQNKRSHPSADVQVINGVPNANYRHLKAVGFALLEASLGNSGACVNSRL